MSDEQTIDLRQRLIETSLKRKSRIEELEAKLAKAVGSMTTTVNVYEEEDHGRYLSWEIENMRTTLAELSSVSCANLKGQDDE